MKFYKFVAHDVDMTHEDAQKLAEYLKTDLSRFTGDGIYKRGGWLFDAREDLNMYLIKEELGYIYEKYAPSVTVLREKLSLRRTEKVKLSPFREKRSTK